MLRFDLASRALDPQAMRALLSADEVRRAEGRLRVRDQVRAVASRALTRLALAAFAGRPPTELVFETGPHGKPRLAGDGPFFSVSHSFDRLLVAVSERSEVGVDVELHDAPRDLDAAERFVCDEADRRAIALLTERERRRAFLRLWTAKEAALKALGTGLGRAMPEVALDAAGLGTLGEEAWRPVAAQVGDATFALEEVSAVDDVACLALRA